MRGLFTLAIALFLSPPMANAQPATVQTTADFLCHTVLNHKSYDYKAYFSPHFINQIPEEAFHSLISDLNGAIGVCQSAEKVSTTTNEGTYKFITPSTRYVTLWFSLDEDNLINGLLLKGVAFPDVVIDSWNAAKLYAQSLPGLTSITIQNFSQKTLSDKDGTERQPLGSGFKLYVLGAVTDLVKNGSLNWNETFPIRADWKSLPSGIMQTWADGKPVPLKTYAEYMIKISDNTAADHLIHIAGRNAVEAELSEMGNHFQNLNSPFLMTSEMFKLKWAAPISLIHSYLNGDKAVRRTLLENEIDPISLAKVGTNGVPMDKPAFTRSIEWFGSTNDLCEAMKSLKEKNSPEVLDVLSKNVPLLNLGAGSPWSYGGYKGGSEPGVLTMTYLLQNKNSQWGCVSMAWNNENQNVSQWIFFDFTSKVLKLAESYF